MQPENIIVMAFDDIATNKESIFILIIYYFYFSFLERKIINF